MKAKKRASRGQISENERHMKSPKAGMVKAAVYLSPEEDALVIQESKIKRRISKQDWIAEAVREKLQQAGHESAGNALSGLSADDLRRVERYTNLLRGVGDDDEFKRAIDANFALFERVLNRKY